MDIRPSFMATTGGEALPLQDVAIDATLRDLMAEAAVTQVYRNDGKTNIEAVYTFPLPLDAVLLDLEVTIGERVLRGAVVEKKAAEERYETAVADGDSAVMLEAAEPGLYTMNVGNVMPGELVTVRFRYALALRWSGDAVRFFLPTTIAPRYGESPLMPHQAPEASLTVENRFGLTVRIEGLLRSARFECPTHKVRHRVDGDASIIELDAARAVMDRDFVLNLTAQGGERSSALCDRDPAGHVVLASFQPLFGGLAQPAPHSVKIVVDCSGSMNGDSIVQAKKALAAILGLMRPADRLNVVAFGSNQRALFAKQEPCTPANLEKARAFCGELEADMGGTEIGGALERAYASKTGAEMSEDVLLITDGEVSDWHPVVHRAVASKHRLFTVGVGAAVAEAFVRALAERTGGACELVSPNEGMAERITRHFQRMSAPRSTSARIVWPDGAAASWPASLRYVFEGDTVVAWARFANPPAGEVALEITTGDGRSHRQAVRVGAVPVAPEDASSLTTLARVAAAMSLVDLDAEQGAKAALDYQLVSKWTNYLVVAERAEGEKAAHLPELRKVKQTLAAGWGGTGRVSSMLMADLPLDACSIAPPSRRPARDGRASVAYDIAAPRTPLHGRIAELRMLVDALNAAPERIGKGMTIAELEALGVPRDLLDPVQAAIAAGKPEAQAVLAFLEDMAKSSIGDSLSTAVKRAIRTAGRRGGMLRRLGFGAKQP
jgi:Ca-activated chloride channel family protein